MRKPFIIANWKMNKNVHESVDFVKAIKEKLPANKEIGIAAQAVSLCNMKKMAGKSQLQIIAQNAASELEGPYTGEISMRSLADAGVTYVMLGHLERRRLFNESNDAINQKVLAALQEGITPIICTDEEMVQTEVNGEIHYVFQQLKSVLKGVSPADLRKIVISYEPSWAVGSSHQANPNIAEEGCREIRQSFADTYSNEVAENIRILYGGSVNPENIGQIMSMPNVDGALIGRASLDIKSFLQMINYVETASKQKITGYLVEEEHTMAYFDNGNKLFADARKNHYAIGAYNINNLEWTRAILRAAAETNTPVLIQVSMGAAKYMGGYKFVKDMVADQMDAMDIKVPVILNLDHGDYEAAIECINLGYSSVMFDGHKLPMEENYAKTKKIVQLAHSRGIAVEAEIGKVGENQDTSSGELASVADAKAFADLGVDKLACGIGNIHGIYPANWQGLNFDRLQEIADAIDIPLVLHGGSGIPKDQVQKAISMGIAKVNINTEFQLAFQDATRKYIENEKDLDQTAKGYDPRKLLLPGTDAITAKMKDMIEWLGTPAVA